MIRFIPHKGDKEKLNILCLGAHCDDIEIGCGTTLLKMIKMNLVKSVYWVVFTSNEVRKKEAHECAGLFLENVSEKKVSILSFKDGFLPAVWTEIKKEFEEIKNEFEPDLIFTHYREDRHQDHRTVSDLTWNTFRNHLVLEYEIPKYDGDLGQPNLFVPAGENLLNLKYDYLSGCFKSQLGKQWFDRELIEALMRIRGTECAAAEKYAEAFYLRKAVI